VGIGGLAWLHDRSSISKPHYGLGSCCLVRWRSWSSVLPEWFGFIHLAQVSGDFERWAVLINVAMIGQGALTILHLWSGRHEATPS